MAVLTPAAAALSTASALASLLTMVYLRCRWDVYASSVRWLFWLFFVWVATRCSMRAVFYVWLSLQPSNRRVDDTDPESWTYGQLNRLGIHGIQYLPQARSVWITCVACLGDLALAGIALTVFPLAYELCRLARIAMDRGVKKEQAQIRRYRLVIGGGLAAYVVVLLVLAVVYDGYNIHTYRCLLCVYGLQFVGLVYMVWQIVLLKVNGRQYETVQGVFVASPVYQRLKTIMLVYAVFAFQFQVSMMIVYILGVSPDNKFLSMLGISLILQNTYGLALAITTSCSQTCFFHAFSSCIPEDLEAQYLQQRLAAPKDEDLEAPLTNPVFVYTDIESSTALWNSVGEAMATATDIHDTILRSALLKHRGYEITTVGDAFQVAFRTMRDAVEYCLDVQLQLLVAKWPKDLNDVIPATSKVRSGRRVIFKGLRVRMGIHDASEEDGQLVKDIHAVTGKTTYSGMSEVIADFVGDLGCGGQILLTNRVATWLKQHRHELSVDVFVKYMGEYSVPHVSANVEIYQLQPIMLASRAKHFPALPRRGASESCLNGDQATRRSRSGRLCFSGARILEEQKAQTPDTLPLTLTSSEETSRSSLDVSFQPLMSPQTLHAPSPTRQRPEQTAKGT